jgi:hypothetical protein
MKRVVLLALIAVCWSSAAAQPRVLFTGPRWDSEFNKVRTAADAASQAAEAKNHQLALTSVFDVFGDEVSPLIAGFQWERIALLAQKRWPKDEVYVISPDTTRMMDVNALTMLFRKLLEQPPAARRMERQRGSGVLPAPEAQADGQRTSLSDQADTHPQWANAQATAQPLLLKAESDLKAKLFRNGVILHDVAGFGPGRGINIALVNQITGEIECIYDFDTWITPSLASQFAKQFVNQILPERIVLLAVADANFLNLVPDAVATFQQKLGTGCGASATFRDTWAGISQAGKSLGEQCGKYTYETGWPDSVAQVMVSPVPSADSTAPGGTFTINSGAAVTDNHLVTLDLAGITDGQSGLIPGGKMRLSNDSTSWSPMMDFATSRTWVLDRGDGPKTVYAQFRDRDGNWTNTLTATIMLKESNPVSVGPQSSLGAFFVSGNTFYSLSTDGTITTSHDFGRHWSKAQTILSSPDSYWNEVVLAGNPSGRVTAIGLDSGKGQLLIAASSSVDGGRTWLNSGIAKIATVNSSKYPNLLQACSSPSGSVVVFWTDEVNMTTQIFALPSPDGLTWGSTPVRVSNVSDPDYLSTWTFRSACLGSTVIAAVRGRNGIKLYRSANGGAAFETAGIEISSDAYSFQLVSDPSSELYYLLARGQSGGANYPITIRRSSDGGATWGIPLLVANTGSLSGDPQARVAGPGLLYVTWIEPVSDSEGDVVRFETSRDGGLTWMGTPATVAVRNYWFSFMFAEKPNVGDLLLAANRTGDVLLLWTDDRRGLGYGGYTIQRFAVASAARASHEDAQTRSANDIYAASSTNFGATWTMAGPLNVHAVDAFIDLQALAVTDSGVAVSMWKSDKLYADIRFLNGTVNLPLTATFDEPAYQGNDSQPISFSLSISNPLAQITWDFGDGSTMAGESGIIHVYKRPGQYAVSATVSDGINRVIATTTVTITDLLTVTAKLKGGGKKLVLSATSSQQETAARPSLTIVETGRDIAFDPSSQTYRAAMKTAGLPSTLTVRSSLGGQATVSWR